MYFETDVVPEKPTSYNKINTEFGNATGSVNVGEKTKHGYDNITMTPDEDTTKGDIKTTKWMLSHNTCIIHMIINILLTLKARGQYTMLHKVE